MSRFGKTFRVACVVAGLMLAVACGWWLGAVRNFVPDMARSVWHLPRASSDQLEDWNRFDFAGHKYPVIYNGEYIAMQGELDGVGHFKPTFSPERRAVNPARPRQVSESKRTLLYFDVPGEYYLDLDLEDENDFKLKVLVLDRSASVSSNVLRVFDFMVANMVVTQGEDQAFYSNAQEFSANFFGSENPGMLLCGPTLAFFEMILADRFNLPVRDVTLTGVFLDQGQVNYATHNVLEVYLPDKEKWVLFDPHNGFVAKWLDAFELTEKIRSASSSKASLTKVEADSLALDVHYEVDARRAVNAADSRSVFFPEMLRSTSVRDDWQSLFTIYLGGPGYWGGKRFGRDGLPADFHLYSSKYHEDPLLLAAQTRWQLNWPLKVQVVAPARLQEMLHAAYAPEISARNWRAYLPAVASSTRP